jgi:hypothetical protein
MHPSKRKIQLKRNKNKRTYHNKSRFNGPISSRFKKNVAENVEYKIDEDVYDLSHLSESHLQV